MLLAFCILVLTGSVVCMEGSDFVFEGDPYTSRALLNTSDDSRFSQLFGRSFTFCFYVFVENDDGSSVSIVSYSAEKELDDKFRLEVKYYNAPYTAVSIHGYSVVFKKVPPIREWTHMCTSWNSKSQKVHLHLDGDKVIGEQKKGVEGIKNEGEDKKTILEYKDKEKSSGEHGSKDRGHKKGEEASGEQEKKNHKHEHRGKVSGEQEKKDHKYEHRGKTSGEQEKKDHKHEHRDKASGKQEKKDHKHEHRGKESGEQEKKDHKHEHRGKTSGEQEKKDHKHEHRDKASGKQEKKDHKHEHRGKESGEQEKKDHKHEHRGKTSGEQEKKDHKHEHRDKASGKQEKKDHKYEHRDKESGEQEKKDHKHEHRGKTSGEQEKKDHKHEHRDKASGKQEKKDDKHEHGLTVNGQQDKKHKKQEHGWKSNEQQDKKDLEQKVIVRGDGEQKKNGHEQQNDGKVVGWLKNKIRERMDWPKIGNQNKKDSGHPGEAKPVGEKKINVHLDFGKEDGKHEKKVHEHRNKGKPSNESKKHVHVHLDLGKEDEKHEKEIHKHQNERKPTNEPKKHVHVHLDLGKEEEHSKEIKTSIEKGKFKNGDNKKEDGYFVIGQSKDSSAVKDDDKEGLKGRMSQINFWGRELSTEEVKRVAKCELSGEVVNWKTSRWLMYDRINVEETTAPCYRKCDAVKRSSCRNMTKSLISPYDLKTGFDDGLPKLVTASLTNVVIPEMTEFTYCYELFVDMVFYQWEILNYKNKEGKNALTFGYRHAKKIMESYVYWGIGSEEARFAIFSLGGNRSYFFCTTWSSSNGSFSLYWNGKLALKLNVSKNYVVPAYGKLSVTQEQDFPLDPKWPTAGFRYKLANFFLWDRLLTDHEVANFTSCTGSVKGFVVDPGRSKWKVEDRGCPAHSKVSAIDDFSESKFKNGEKIRVSSHEGMYSHIKRPNLTEFSFCFWIYSETDNPKVENFLMNYNSIRISSEVDGIRFLFNGEGTTFPGKFIHALSWQHICLTWSSEEGLTQLFVDGKAESGITGIAVGRNVNKVESWRFTNVQYEPASRDNPTKGFAWKLTELNMWMSVLSAKQVAQARKCSLVKGDGMYDGDVAWFIR